MASIDKSERQLKAQPVSSRFSLRAHAARKSLRLHCSDCYGAVREKVIRSGSSEGYASDFGCWTSRSYVSYPFAAAASARMCSVDMIVTLPEEVLGASGSRLAIVVSISKVSQGCMSRNPRANGFRQLCFLGSKPRAEGVFG